MMSDDEKPPSGKSFNTWHHSEKANVASRRPDTVELGDTEEIMSESQIARCMANERPFMESHESDSDNELKLNTDYGTAYRNLWGDHVKVKKELDKVKGKLVRSQKLIRHLTRQMDAIHQLSKTSHADKAFMYDSDKYDIKYICCFVKSKEKWGKSFYYCLCYCLLEKEIVIAQVLIVGYDYTHI